MIAAADDPFFSEIQDVHFSESQFHAYCVYLSLAFGFLAAIKRKDNDKIVSDMSHILFAADFGHYHDSVTGDSAGSTRASMLSLICYNACVRGHFEVTMRLLEEPLEIGFVDLEKMLMVVTDKKKQIPGVEALVDMILKKMMELNQLPLIKRIDDSGAVVRPEENGPQDMRFMLAAAMEKAIISCIDQKHHSITPLLLKRYLQMVAEYPAADRQITSAFFEDIAPESYMALSREQCVDLLTLDIPTVVTRGLLRRLCLDPDKEPMDMLLTAQGQTFKAHRDVLSHWSSYFRGLTGHDWVDRNHVKFENNISASALRAVITFVYAGEYQNRGHGDQQAKLEDLLYTADYFGILPLQEQVSGLLDEIEEEEDG
ncbi:hypothetical protein BJX61DRAFT_502069 [Aspergillus egyptiacus]|nr:hypothetical protein BJX61DRAFT_502069 [Aspergillus egyptiacus]